MFELNYNAYMKPTIVQCQFDNTVGWLLYICNNNFICIISTARLLIYMLKVKVEQIWKTESGKHSLNLKNILQNNKWKGSENYKKKLLL